MSKAVNAFYGQSGGVTTVINATAQGVIETTRQHRNQIHKLFAGKHGIVGLINEQLYDTNQESRYAISQMHNYPGGIFGSCRFKLPEIDQDPELYKKIVRILDAHNIHYFFYNGGNDSADTAHKIALLRDHFNYPISCIAIPKTIDNDLPITDTCPGYGSVAKFVATTTKEAGIDLAAMDHSIQVYILTTMGRNSGWIAGASGLARNHPDEAPHIILFPEIAFDRQKFFKGVLQSEHRF